MHLEPGVEAALQECHVQELLEPSPHLNEQRMSVSIFKDSEGISLASDSTRPRICFELEVGITMSSKIDDTLDQSSQHNKFSL